jgi:uncharacterized PurR-regulated membrane protein YhhQ (DUF165 family)
MKKNRIWGFGSLAAFLLTIPLANYFVASVGTYCPLGGPCLIPVAPGVMSPSGVIWAGLALILRDLVQRQLGIAWSSIGILVGAGLSFFISPSLAMASAVAFLISELLDLAVYTPLQKRGLILAVVASTLVGLVADSLAFLWVAFGSFDHLLGQALGKAWMILISLPFLYWLRTRDKRELLSSERLPKGSAAAHFQTS